MFALNLLSESTNQPDLSWLLWVVLIFFLLIIVVGWLTSKKADKAAVAADTVPRDSDDLTRLEGIGPKVSKVLAAAGVTTFAQLANADVAKVEAALEEAGLQMMDPSGWIEQAALAAKGDWDALAKLQDELKGGRHV
ncbi:MAG: DUF4332 domain-containing protein [Chloroflexi bacterium]|nr:DUF4332 domain-containing protein [Chloroflexota bacterium]